MEAVAYMFQGETVWGIGKVLASFVVSLFVLHANMWPTRGVWGSKMSWVDATCRGMKGMTTTLFT